MSNAHVQELRGHYVRRLPTPTEISARPPIAFGQHDRQILVAAHRHDFMTTDLVELHAIGRMTVQELPTVMGAASPLVGIAGAAMGFYFGGEERRKS